jgi:STE24 endopeptidase
VDHTTVLNKAGPRLSVPDRATVYHRWQLWLGALELALTGAVLLALLGTGVGPWLRGFGEARHLPPWLQVALIAVALGLAVEALGAPLDWARGYWLPRRFDLLRQGLGGWVLDRLKAALLGGALGLAAAEIVYALLRNAPLWWLWAAGMLLAGSALVAMVVPIWILPLFYKLTPLEDVALESRLLELGRRAGVAVVGVWVADQSRKSRAANAALAGLGGTRRILLFDTLLRGFTPDEIESVLAHELGHHVHGDVRRGLLVQGALLLTTLWVADRILQATIGGLGLEGAGDPAGLPLLALVLFLLGLLAAPIANAFSRRVERQADDFALAATGNPGAFVSALERLAELNLAERRPARLKELLFQSHPSIDRRIERARQWRR